MPVISSTLILFSLSIDYVSITHSLILFTDLIVKSYNSSLLPKRRGSCFKL